MPAETKAVLHELLEPLQQKSESDLIRYLINRGLEAEHDQTDDAQLRALADQVLGCR